MAVGRFFFATALTAQNSPDYHFRFTNSFIQPSLVGSLCHLQGSAIPDTCLMKYATVPPNANAEKIQLSKVKFWTAIFVGVVLNPLSWPDFSPKLAMNP